MCGKRLEQRLFKREADASKIRGMFGLRVDADWSPELLRQLLRQGNDLVEGRDLELAVVVVGPKRQTLLRAQRLDLRQREVLGEPASHLAAVDRLRSPAIRKSDLHVRGSTDLVLMASDEYAVPGRHEVGLDKVRSARRGKTISLQRMLGQPAGNAAVADDEYQDEKML
jgi:hypothetical protein